MNHYSTANLDSGISFKTLPTISYFNMSSVDLKFAVKGLKKKLGYYQAKQGQLNNGAQHAVQFRGLLGTETTGELSYPDVGLIISQNQTGLLTLPVTGGSNDHVQEYFPSDAESFVLKDDNKLLVFWQTYQISQFGLYRVTEYIIIDSVNIKINIICTIDNYGNDIVTYHGLSVGATLLNYKSKIVAFPVQKKTKVTIRTVWETKESVFSVSVSQEEPSSYDPSTLFPYVADGNSYTLVKNDTMKYVALKKNNEYLSIAELDTPIEKLNYVITDIVDGASVKTYFKYTPSKNQHIKI
jgi:hypothetical protein